MRQKKFAKMNWPSFRLRSLLFSLFIIGITSQSFSLTVNLSEAGTLEDELGGSLASTTNLTITGSMDARDFRTMRDLMPSLTSINLSGATIEAYSGLGGTMETSSTVYYANTVPRRAFQYKDNLTTVVLPSSATSIEEYIFSQCSSLNSVTLPPNIPEIADGTFSGCQSLSSLNIPSSVTVLGSSSFSGVNITSITLPPNLTTIEYYAFNGSALETVTIPSTVTSIGNRAFSNCSTLTSVSIPSSVSTFGEAVFSNCINLTSADFPNTSITEIPERTFYACENLSSFEIPASATSIGDYAFSQSGLTSITIPSNVATMGNSSFRYCTSLSSVTLTTQESISEYCFSSCEALTSINIPETVTTIDANSFSHSGITSVTIPESVTNIGRSVFYGCYDLVSAEFPSNIDIINYGTFSSCTSLVAFEIPEEVTTIGGGAFGNCSGLKSIDIPESVIDIQRRAFINCSSLEYIVSRSEATNTLTQNDVFSGVDFENCILYVPLDNIPDYEIAEQWGDFQQISSYQSEVDHDHSRYPVPDGMIVTNINSYMWCELDLNVEYYEWEFKNVATETVVTRNGSRGYMRYSWIPNFEIGATYEVRVRPMFTGWEGEFDEPTTIIISVDNLPVISIGGNVVMEERGEEIYCDLVLSANEYQWEFTGPNGFSASYSTYSQSKNHVDPFYLGVSYGETYSVRVRARIGVSTGEWGPAYNVTTPPYESKSFFAEEDATIIPEKVKVFPTVVEGSFTVAIPEYFEAASATVIDLFGNTKGNQTLEAGIENNISIAYLAAGQYFVQIKAQNTATETFKIIKK